ncbi:hypothetical protein [Azospirillum halopraeferens]|uniref:hypothetical protein n=1 Tax=Azospirillum halopraeferens TaxID=34010 RepID=UPI000428C1A1|nr:hypothetical protein [Azospirillum halopraeferens]
MIPPLGRHLPALRDIREMSGQGGLRVATPPEGAAAGPPALLTLVRVTGDTTVCVDRRWLAAASPDDAARLAALHFAEVRRRLDALALALRHLGTGLAGAVVAAEVALLALTGDRLPDSAGAAVAALRALAAGDAAAALTAAAPLLNATAGGLMWPLLPPLLGWGARIAATLALRRHFLGDRTNGRTAFRFRPRRPQPGYPAAGHDTTGR